MDQVVLITRVIIFVLVSYIYLGSYVSLLPANLSPCLKELRRALGYTNQVIKGRFKPRCKIDGSYEEMQCLEFGVRYETCWCVDSDGKELVGTRVSGKVSCVPKTGKKGFVNGLLPIAAPAYSLACLDNA